MTLPRKVGVSAVFATGFFACVCSIMRIVFSSDKKFGYYQTNLMRLIHYFLILSTLWNILLTAPSSHGEIASGIISGCMPVLPLFYHHVVPKLTTILSADSRNSKPASHTSDPAHGALNHVGMMSGGYVELGKRQVLPFEATRRQQLENAE